MAGEDLGRVFVEGGLGGGVVGEHRGEGFQVFDEVGVRKMAGFEVGEEGGEADCGCDGEESGAVGGRAQEVEKSGKEEAGGLLFGREAEKLSVEGEDLLFSATMVNFGSCQG